MPTDLPDHKTRLERYARNLISLWKEEWDSKYVPREDASFIKWLEYRVRRGFERYKDKQDTRFMLKYIAIRHLSPLVTCELIEEFNLHNV